MAVLDNRVSMSMGMRTRACDDTAVGALSPGKLTVLVADENHDGASMLSMLVASLGHRVSTAANGEARRRCAGRKPCVPTPASSISACPTWTA